MPLASLQRILFPTDFSACAEGAFRHAAYLADRFATELHVLHVVQDEAAPERDWPDAPGTGSLHITMADVCSDLGLPPPSPETEGDVMDRVEVIEEEVVGRDPAEAILDYARDEEAGLIVIGTNGRRGWRRAVLGSVAEAVVRRAPCPVLTVRPHDREASPWPPERILAAVDVEPDDDALPLAAQWAVRMGAAYGVPVDLLHVTRPVAVPLVGPDEAAQERTVAREVILALAKRLRAEAEGPVPIHVTVRTGLPEATIQALAEERRAHLIAVGTSGRSGPGRALLGSVAESVVREAPCPVLVVRDALAGQGS